MAVGVATDPAWTVYRKMIFDVMAPLAMRDEARPDSDSSERAVNGETAGANRS
jgi:hypothetical protein